MQFDSRFWWKNEISLNLPRVSFFFLKKCPRVPDLALHGPVHGCVQSGLVVASFQRVFCVSSLLVEEEEKSKGV